MKIAAKSTREFLQAPDKNCYGTLLYGPDAGLVRERMQTISARILAGSDDPFGRVEVTEDQLKNDPARLSDELCAMSLLGGRRLVLLRDAGDKSTKAVQAAMERADGENYLLICADELGPRSSLRALFESHAKLAALACYKDEAMDLQTVIRQKFEAAGIQCGRDAMAYLQAHLGNDRAVTLSELDKIILYLGDERTLTPEIAQALVGHNRDVTLDALNTELALGNLAALDALLTQGLKEGMQPVMLLRAAQRHFQRLLGVKEAVMAGKPVDQAVAALKPPLFFRAVQPFTRQVQEWPLPRILAALSVLNEAELATKQSGAVPGLLISRAFLQVGTMARRQAA